MDSVEQLKKDLPVAMTMAAFIGISWYVARAYEVVRFIDFPPAGSLLWN